MSRRRDPAPPPLAAAVRAALLAAGLSDREVARRTGVAYQVISRFRREERDILLATAERILRGLGLAVEVRATTTQE